MTKKGEWGNGNAGEAVCLQRTINSEAKLKFFNQHQICTCIHAQTLIWKKLADEKQTESEVQAEVFLKRIVGIFYVVVVVVPVLWDLPAAGDNGPEYRLPSFPANCPNAEVTFLCHVSSPTEASPITLPLNDQKKGNMYH